MARFLDAATIVNRTAVLIGLNEVADPYGSSDPAFKQLFSHLTHIGQELIYDYPWEQLLREESFTTVVPGDTGDYDLPTDFAYMIDQTGWNRTSYESLKGPYTAQNWQYVIGSGLGSQNTIYVAFRKAQGKLRLYPQPPPNGLNIVYEYISRNWVVPASDPSSYADEVVANGDVILYDPSMLINRLRLSYLTAKGFDTTEAKTDFLRSFHLVTSKDQPAPILSLRRKRPGNLIDMSNVPETGYGGP